MVEKITYYAMLLEGDTRRNPSGVSRRRECDDGLLDEAFQRNLSWAPTPLIASWKRGDTTFDFIEISEDEANQIIDAFREQWSSRQ
jgi:L-ribulose-5-phosphate 3-epimerase UlaE